MATSYNIWFSNRKNLRKEIHCSVGEKSWSRETDDEDESNEENFEGKVLNVKMPFHPMDRRSLTERMQPMSEQLFPVTTKIIIEF